MKSSLLILLFFSLSFYGQNDTIADVKTSNISVVSADKMNVVYRGLPNPISIYLPNYIPFSASAPGLSKNETGKYILTPGAGNEVFVIVVYKKNDGNSVAEKHKFKILNMPPFDLIIGDMRYSVCPSCILEISIEEFKNPKLSIETNRAFPYELPFKISSMTFVFSNDEYIRVEGNIISEEVFREIEKLKKGEIFTIRFALDTNFDVFVNPLKVMIKE